MQSDGIVTRICRRVALWFRAAFDEPEGPRWKSGGVSGAGTDTRNHDHFGTERRRVPLWGTNF